MTKVYLVTAGYVDKSNQYVHYVSEVFTNIKKAKSYQKFMKEIIPQKTWDIEAWDINNMDYSEQYEKIKELPY